MTSDFGQRCNTALNALGKNRVAGGQNRSRGAYRIEHLGSTDVGLGNHDLSEA